MKRGTPVIIVMPGAIYGPGGQGLVAELMRIFWRGYPVVASADTVLTFAHVADIAEGHILAAEKGRMGETYILSGPAVPLGDMLDFWSYLTGKKAPPIRLPSVLVRNSVPLMALWGRVSGLNAAFSREGAELAGASLIANSEKARKELGWETMPLQRGMVETLKWVAESEAGRTEQIRRREKRMGAIALIMAGLITAGWLTSRWSK